MSKEDFLDGLKQFEKSPEDIKQDSLNDLLKAFEQMSDKDIMESIKKLNDLSREQLKLKALSIRNLELVNRINIAMRNIETEQIENLRVAIKNGKQEEMLSQLSWLEKSNLSAIIESRNNILVGFDVDFSKASPEDRALLEALKKSIDKDFLEQAKSEGFNNLEAWRAHNSGKHKNNIQHDDSSRL